MNKKLSISFFWLLALLQGCAAVNTFPAIARAGDTVSVMVGGSEQMRKETIGVTLTGSNGQTWDLKALGMVRSVFNLRTDGRAYGAHYSGYFDSEISWAYGHEPVQTVLVTDIPPNVPPGVATLRINTGVTDNSSGVADPLNVNLEIIAGTGKSENFLRQDAFLTTKPVIFSKLEPAPHAKITFGTSGQIIGAVSLQVSFNKAVLNADDINVYVPESTVRGSVLNTGSFGATQRMVYWRKGDGKVYIDVVAPQGIDSKYLQLYLVHPTGLSGPVNFSVTSTAIYDVNGNVVSSAPSIGYFP